MKIVWYIAAGMLFLGAVSMPSVYYDLLRVSIFGAGVLAAYKNYEEDNKSWVMVFAIIAIIFNPFIPLYLYEKLSWLIIDMLAAFLFILNSRKIKD